MRSRTGLCRHCEGDRQVTPASLSRIIAFTEAEIARRRALQVPAWRIAEAREFISLLSDVQFAAMAVRDGHGSVEELDALIEEVDWIDLYRAVLPAVAQLERAA